MKCDKVLELLEKQNNFSSHFLGLDRNFSTLKCDVVFKYSQIIFQSSCLNWVLYLTIFLNAVEDNNSMNDYLFHIKK